MKKAEQSIEDTEEKLSLLDAEMARPEVATDPVKLNELDQKANSLRTLLESLYEEWEALSEQAELSRKE